MDSPENQAYHSVISMLQYVFMLSPFHSGLSKGLNYVREIALLSGQTLWVLWPHARLENENSSNEVVAPILSLHIWPLPFPWDPSLKFRNFSQLHCRCGVMKLWLTTLYLINLIQLWRSKKHINKYQRWNLWINSSPRQCTRRYKIRRSVISVMTAITGNVYQLSTWYKYYELASPHSQHKSPKNFAKTRGHFSGCESFLEWATDLQFMRGWRWFFIWSGVFVSLPGWKAQEAAEVVSDPCVISEHPLRDILKCHLLSFFSSIA